MESSLQSKVIRELRTAFPTAIIIKNDASYIQGIPDFTILYHNVWIFIEFKDKSKSAYRPNQEYYLDLAKQWSFSFTVSHDNWNSVKPNLFNILNFAERNNFYDGLIQ